MSCVFLREFGVPMVVLLYYFIRYKALDLQFENKYIPDKYAVSRRVYSLYCNILCFVDSLTVDLLCHVDRPNAYWSVYLSMHDASQEVYIMYTYYI